MKNSDFIYSLLDGTIDKKFNDRVFWYASRVEFYEKEIKLYMNENSLTKFDNVEFPFNIPTVSELSQIKQKSEAILENVLIASGSFLFINDKLLVTKRTNDTKYDPLHWTTPAGRSDRNLYITALKETIEEIEVIDKNQNRLYPHITKELFNDLNNKRFYEVNFENKAFPIKTYRVEVYIENKLFESVNLWAGYTKRANTLEFRLPIFGYLDEEIELKNPEYFTETKLLTLQELRNYKCVPAVKKLVEELVKD